DTQHTHTHMLICTSHAYIHKAHVFSAYSAFNLPSPLFSPLLSSLLPFPYLSHLTSLIFSHLLTLFISLLSFPLSLSPPPPLSSLSLSLPLPLHFPLFFLSFTLSLSLSLSLFLSLLLS